MTDQKSPEAFRTISEVADWLGVPTHVLRFWESRFAQVKPVKRAGGRRYYRPSDMELLGGIRKLLHEDGMTIRGVQKLLREQGVKHVAAMSPGLDETPGERDITPDNVVDLSHRRGGQDSADTSDDSDDDEERRFPFDDDPVPQPEPEPEPIAEDAASADEAKDAPQGDHETANAETQAEATEGDSEAAVGDDEAVDTEADAVVDTALPDPEAMEFFAHDATPETYEDPAPETDQAAPAPPPETDPDDPMSSPEALDFAAHDAEPDLGETGDDETSDAGPEPAPVDAAPPVMPDIGPDPEDDDGPPALPVAARLRHARALRADLPAGALQALSDRLTELRRRIQDVQGPRGGV